MRTSQSSQVATREKRNIARVFGVALLTSALLTGGLTSASAVGSATISGTYPANQTAYWGTPRYNTQQYNKVRVYLNSYSSPSTIFFGIRNPAGTTLGTTSGTLSQWKNMTASNGSGAMPRGTFYMNSLINYYCGNPLSCTIPDQSFNAQLQWDIAW